MQHPQRHRPYFNADPHAVPFHTDSPSELPSAMRGPPGCIAITPRFSRTATVGLNSGDVVCNTITIQNSNNITQPSPQQPHHLFLQSGAYGPSVGIDETSFYHCLDSFAEDSPAPPTATVTSMTPEPVVASRPRPPAPQSAPCNGLKFANFQKEKAREEYKEKRRLELLQQGEVDRIKRRRKNDTSMSERQKYSRRLKMNQDSAAAARFAQDVYVQTLESLVSASDQEKHCLKSEIDQLRAECSKLARQVDELQHRAGPDLVEAEAAEEAAAERAVVAPTCGVFSEKNDPVDFLVDFQDDEPQLSFSEDLSNFESSGSSALVLRKILDLFEAPETTSALQSDPNFSCGMFGVLPTRAV